jgi:predicted dehydrogenase
VKVGIIGAGNISDTHVRAAQSIPGVEIAAVYSPNVEKASRLAARAGVPAYGDLSRFLAHRPMEMVAVGSPSGLHAEQAIAAAKRGLHVLVEKPLDISTARVDDVIAAADRHRVTVGVCFQDRLEPDIVRMKLLIDTGRLGTPVLASGRVKWHRPPEYYAGSKWRGTLALDGGGALINQAIHTIDLIQWLFGPVSAVSAMTATRVHDIEAEDTAAAILEFASGAIAIFEAATSVYPGYARRVELTGSEGTLILDQATLVASDLRTGAATGPPAGSAASATTPAVADAEPHRRIFENFIRAVETGASPVCDAREGRKSVAIVEAIYEAAKTGRRVPMVSPGGSPR